MWVRTRFARAARLEGIQDAEGGKDGRDLPRRHYRLRQEHRTNAEEQAELDDLRAAALTTHQIGSTWPRQGAGMHLAFGSCRQQNRRHFQQLACATLRSCMA